MLTVRELSARDFMRWYSAVESDFDEKELIPPRAVRGAIRSGAQEFLLFTDEETGLPQGYALCCVKNVYGYVLLKYFGILPWYRDKGLGVEAMRLLHKRYADRQGILAELTVFDDSDGGDYFRKLQRFFRRFGYEEVPFSYRIGGARVFLTAKTLKSRIRDPEELAKLAPRILTDFYSRCLRPSEMEKMLSRDP